MRARGGAFPVIEGACASSWAIHATFHAGTLRAVIAKRSSGEVSAPTKTDCCAERGCSVVPFPLSSAAEYDVLSAHAAASRRVFLSARPCGPTVVTLHRPVPPVSSRTVRVFS